MDALNDQKAWDEAMARVTRYIAAVEIGGAEHCARVAMRILDRARDRCAKTPGLPAVEAAMSEAEEMLRIWFSGILPGPEETVVERGLIAMRATEVARRWPNAVLAPEVPAELRLALLQASTPAGPELALSSMAAQEMDFGAMEAIAQETWQQFRWAPLLGAAALWTVIFFLALYTYDRFFAP